MNTKTGAAPEDRTARLSRILETISDAVLELDGDLVVRYFNTVAERVLGRARGAVIGRRLFEAFPETRGSIIEENILRAAREHVALCFEVHFDVAPYCNWYDFRILPVEDGLVVFFQVTTQRRAMEAGLRDRERVLVDILESTLSGYWDRNIPAGTEYLSPAFKKILGYEDHELPNLPESWQRLIFAEDLPAVLEGFDRHVRSNGRERYYHEVRYRHKGGSTVWVACTGRVIEWAADGSPVRMVGCHIDITEHKRIERAALESRLLLQNFLDSSAALSFATDLDGRFTLANRALEHLFDRAPGSLIGCTRAEAIPGMPEMVATEHRNNDIDVVKSGLPIEFDECNIQADGEHIYRSVKFPIRGADGKIVGIGGISTDVTDRRLAERDLRNERERLRTILDTVGDPIFVKDNDHRVILANRAFDQIFGLEEGMAIGKTLAEHVPPEERVHFMAVDRRVLDTGIPDVREETLTVRGSEPRTIVTTKVRLVDDSGARFLVGTIHDVTELKRKEQERLRLQEQLHHAQKMEAVGTLAGGVAHDFNNILGGVLSGLSLLELELGEAIGRHRNDLKDIKELVQRGAELSRQLLGFSRRGKYDVAPRNVREIAQKTAELFGRAQRHVALVLDFAPDLDSVLVDHAQLEQVLLNLLINAAHAMPGGGRVAIRGENVSLGTQETAPHGVPPGRFVRMVVADTGTGIPPADLSRIFEPFFTTKAPGQGTGLGLASVYGIVKNHGGFVTVESELGKGTTFSVVLPSTDRPLVTKEKTQVAIRPGRGTLLVVDDEEQLLRLTARLLSALGYEVLTASRGQTAVELVAQHRDRISLVILDLTMPEMSGTATFDAIRKIAPSLRVLLASGFAIDGQAQALLDRGCSGFIQKPFDAAALAEKLRTLGEESREL